MATNTTLVVHKRQPSSSTSPSAAKGACIAQAVNVPTRSLLNLPAEVRVQILRTALWHPEPLRFFNIRQTFDDWTIDDVELKPNFRLDVQILRVCRQLHAEGILILYGNTVGCVYRSSMPDLCSYLSLEYDIFAGHHIETTWTNPGNGTTAPPNHLFAHMRKLDVTILVVIGEYSNRNECPHWTHLSVRVLPELPQDCYDNFNRPEIRKDISWPEHVAKSMEPFELLSGLKSANFEGIGSDQGGRLQRLATGSPRPAIMPKTLGDLQAQQMKVDAVSSALGDMCARPDTDWPVMMPTLPACEEAERALKKDCEATFLAAHARAQSLINKCLKVAYCAYLERYRAQNAKTMEEQWQILDICRSFLISSDTRMTNEEYMTIIQLARITSHYMY